MCLEVLSPRIHRAAQQCALWARCGRSVGTPWLLRAAPAVQTWAVSSLLLLGSEHVSLPTCMSPAVKRFPEVRVLCRRECALVTLTGFVKLSAVGMGPIGSHQNGARVCFPTAFLTALHLPVT